MTIGRKIMLAYGIPVAFTLVTGGVSIIRMRAMNETVQALAIGSLRGTNAVGRLAGIAKDTRGGIRGHITGADADAKAKAEQDLAGLERMTQKELREYRATISDPRDRELFAALPDALRQLSGSAAPILPLSRANQTDQAMALFRAQTMPAYLRAQRAIENLAQFKEQDGNSKAAQAAASVAATRVWMWIAVALSFFSCGAIGWSLSRHINVVLISAVRSLKAASSELNLATREVAESSTSLARDTNQQSASLEQTSVSSVEIRDMATRNAGNSRMATRDVEQMVSKLDSSNKAVQNMVVSMKSINASNQNVFKVIGVIDGIAFQTNMLALNASVEAARAGQNGLGFAVVADEVRTLAQRAAQAARDSTAIVEDLLAKSTASQTQLDEIAQSIDSITGNAARVKALIQEVEAGSQEQARGIEQVSEAVVHMEQVTTRTAGMADRGASASRNLSVQSEALRNIVASLITLVEGR